MDARRLLLPILQALAAGLTGAAGVAFLMALWSSLEIVF
jgi:hypothetical protein